MGVDLTAQAVQAGAALALGLASGLLYDFTRVVRRHVRGGLFAAFCDGAYWLSCFTVLYIMGLSVADGQQRGFLAVFAALGGGAYLYLASPFMLPVVGAICRFSAKILGFCLFPLVLLGRWIRKFLKIFKKLFHCLKNRCTIVYNTLSRRCKQRTHTDTEDADLEAETIRYTY